MRDGPPVRYRLVAVDPAAHLFEVTCTVLDPDSAGQVFSLPTWIPGSYMVRDFARHVVRLWASSNGLPVSVTKTDKCTWCCEPCEGPLDVRYEVYAWDLSVRAAHLDTSHGYFNGTSVFLCAQGKDDRPCILEIQAPEGSAYASWRVATSMSRLEAAPQAFGTYRAADYEELLDHPVEMGLFDLAGFEACGVPHDIVLSGRHRADVSRLCVDLQRICEHHIRFFGEPAPVDRYVFLILAVGEGYGGLEHRASCSLLCCRDDLPAKGEDTPGDGYRRFLGLCSHEYFHTWNVKRIKPAAFVPYDLRREMHTGLLWAFEGITSYYDHLSLVRAGLISPESYLESLGQLVTRVWRGQGRFKQSLVESSFDAWTKFYKQDENAPNAIVSYYTKGALVALALDLLVRRHTDDECSLDRIMRALWERYGRNGMGLPEDGVERLAEEVSGVSLGAFFNQALRGTEDLPLADMLAYVGIDFQLRCAESQEDKGGKPSSTASDGPRAVLGVRSRSGNGGCELSHVFEGGAAHASGLSAGDVVVAVDGIRVTGNELEARVAAHSVGDRVSVHVFRRDELREFHVELRKAPADTCVLYMMDNADQATKARRDAWLRGVSKQTAQAHGPGS